MEMTFRQSMTLHQSLGLRFDQCAPKPTKDGASALIVASIGYSKKEIPASELEALVQVFFPGWTVNELPKRVFRRKKKADSGASVPESVVESVPESVVESVPESVEGDEIARLQKELERAIAEKARKEAEEKARKEAAERERKERKFSIHTEKVNVDYIRPSNFDLVALLVTARENLLLIGPAGCGKTRMLKEVAKVLDKDLYTFSFAGGLRQAQIFGSTQLRDGKTEWVASAFIEAIQKPGIVFMDEIFSVDPECLQGLNGILEDRVWTSPCGTVKVHEECSLVGASNTNGRTNSPKHTGVNRVDDALVSRFAKEICDYDIEAEKALVRAFNIPEEQDLLDKWQDMRSAIKANNILFDVSTRALLQACRYIKLGIGYDKAVDLSVRNALSKAENAKIS